MPFQIPVAQGGINHGVYRPFIERTYPRVGGLQHHGGVEEHGGEHGAAHGILHDVEALEGPLGLEHAHAELELPLLRARQRVLNLGHLRKGWEGEKVKVYRERRGQGDRKGRGGGGGVALISISIYIYISR